MKRCKECGWHIKPGYEVCENCGSNLSETGITEEAFQEIQLKKREEMIREWQENGGQKKGRLGCLIFFVIIASLIGLAAMSQMSGVSDDMLAIPLVIVFGLINLIFFNAIKKKTFSKKRFYELSPPMTSRMFCTQCGNEIGANEMFCSNCGRKKGE